MLAGRCATPPGAAASAAAEIAAGWCDLRAVGARRRNARDRGGPVAERAMREYQQQAIELGFLHSRYLRGTAPPDFAERGHGDGRSGCSAAALVQFPGAEVRPAACPARPPGRVPVTPSRPRRRPTTTAEMVTALVRLRAALQGAVLPLELPGVEEHRARAAEMVDQLEDYVIPRLIVTLEAPLLAVVGGSTGAGKSTLVNSLVGARRHRARRAPPDDPLAGAGAQPRRRRLVRRRTGCCPSSSGSTAPTDDPGALQLVAARRRAPGPGDPRRPRHRLGRGAQPHARRPAARRRRPVAVRHLGRAVRRPGAVGLPAPGRRALGRGRDRARPHPADAVDDGRRPPRPDARRARAARTRRCSPSNEGALNDDGLLPPREVAEIRRWLTELGRRRRRPRRAWCKQTLEGAIRSLTRRAHTSPTRASSRSPPPSGCARTPTRRTTRRSRKLLEASADGTLLRGEVLVRWQEFVGTGELLEGLEARVGWLRDRVVNAVKGKPQQAERVTVAVESGLETLILEHAEAAAERAEASWQSAGAGPAAARRRRRGPRPRLARASARRAERAVRDWQQDVLEMVRTEGADKRTHRALPRLRRQRAVGRADGRGVRPDRRASPAPRSASPAAAPCSGRSCSRRSSATRPCAAWPSGARRELEARVRALLDDGAGPLPRPARQPRHRRRRRRAAARRSRRRRRPALRRHADGPSHPH